MSVDNLGSAKGLNAKQIAEVQLAKSIDNDVDIDWGSLQVGGEEAIVANGIPGDPMVRQAFIVHEDTAYALTLNPIDASMPVATQEAELLWDIVVSSFTFIEKQPTSASPPDSCAPNSEFVGDVTVPDGTAFVVGSSFVKIWRMRNNGTCAWDDSYHFVQVEGGGNDLIAYPQAVPLPAAQPGEEVDISVTLQLGSEAPLHRELVALFQMRTPSGKYFGAIPFVKVVALPESVTRKPGSPNASLTGIVWNDVCSISELGLPMDGCVRMDDGRLRANGIIDDNEEGIAGLTVSLTPGVCEIIEGIFTTVTAGDGRYGFYGLNPGPYCIFVDPILETNMAILTSGGFTSPIVGVGGLTVYVNEGEDSVVNFGWDYNFEW